MDCNTLGVIGGVGPLSTAYFMEVLINMTDAATDQEHLDMILLNHCEIPDRTAFILDHTKENPLPMMVADAKKLEGLGCGAIVTPCNTAHYFWNELQAAVGVPFINMIEETASLLSTKGASRVGIMATSGTASTGLFQKALSARGIEPVLPSMQNQQYVMDIIYDSIKAGKPVDFNRFKGVIGDLRLNGCDHVILGCTELSILKRDFGLDDFFVDSLEVLCEAALRFFGKKIKLRI